MQDVPRPLVQVFERCERYFPGRSVSTATDSGIERPSRRPTAATPVDGDAVLVGGVRFALT
jgi:hypothetical protein